jgi:hypothetical protein
MQNAELAIPGHFELSAFCILHSAFGIAAAGFS